MPGRQVEFIRERGHGMNLPATIRWYTNAPKWLALKRPTDDTSSPEMRGRATRASATPLTFCQRQTNYRHYRNATRTPP